MKLNQVIAIEKGVKSRVYSETTETHKLCQKPELFNGFSKKYASLKDDGDKLPPESKRVQFSVKDLCASTKKSMSELFDVTAAKDWANTKAIADIKVGDRVIKAGVPVTYLLFLEKQLNDIRTFVAELPELDPNNEWKLDAESALYKTDMIETHRTKKDIKVVTKFEPTKEHPGQAELLQTDIIEGNWQKIDHSGATPKPDKLAMLERVEALIKAVKFAREEANGIDADRQSVGEEIFAYIGF